MKRRTGKKIGKILLLVALLAIVGGIVYAVLTWPMYPDRQKPAESYQQMKQTAEDLGVLAPPEDVLLARRYLHVDDREGFNWAMIRTAMMSVADTAIFPMADFLGLGSEGRINVPSTVGGNWRWRIGEGCINDWLAGIIRENTELYGRAPRAPQEAPEDAAPADKPE